MTRPLAGNGSGPRPGPDRGGPRPAVLPDTPVVRADGLARRYRVGRRTVNAIERISLEVAAGEILGISGPSGCGKSTLLRLLGGLEPPDEGTLLYGDQAAWVRRPSLITTRLVRSGRFPRSARATRSAGSRKRFAGYPRPGYVMAVFQDPFASVDPRWPLWRTITEPLTVGRPRLSGAERRSEAARWLDRADLEHLSPDTRPGELSGGQCQRLALVRAMVAEPSLVLADEPTARQDVITAASMTALLRRAADRGAALVVVSHDHTWLDHLADRILVL